MGRVVTVDAPATTANLGSGFDALAMALDLRNVISVEALPAAAGARPGKVDLRVEGEGQGRLRADRRNRFVSSLERGLAELGAPIEGITWCVRMRNRIPLARGLGSSASVTIAGLLAADALYGRGALPGARILELASEAEGHPDNVAAALLGGFVVVAMLDGAPHAVRLEPPPELLTVVFVPDRPLSTKSMRAALPARVAFADATHNLAASAMTVAAMATGRLDLLRAGTLDRLHEPARARAYPELPRLTAAARAAGALGACLSGAGSSIIAFTDDGDRAALISLALCDEAAALHLDGRCIVVRPRSQGALVLD
jgi:homoserine kinase